ncbi:hypothetical protein RhiirC2_870071 [Rhizophagus irregularis]|uniref:Uncharacterized protein n=1 Tax=Rhizophagus irregularis TaxID=588596 RepID=A0A2N1MM12_9GLOM|nr:hypothetical protein RhiirC2_870071 [Rhizophagus irregularis]
MQVQIVQPMILAMNITACAATNCVEDPVPLEGAEMMPTDSEVVDVIIGRLVWRVLGLVTDSTEHLELLTPAGIMDFPKKEIKVTQNAKVVPIKIDFCGTAIAKYGNDRHIRFGWSLKL